jgi:hypothetical protein
MDEIVRELEQNAQKVRYGSVGVELHIHDGRIVKTVYSTTKTRIGCASGDKAGEQKQANA